MAHGGSRVNRRRFLKLAAGTAGGIAASSVLGSVGRGRGRGTVSAQVPPPTMVDPLYTAPILNPGAVPQFVNTLPVVRNLGLRIDATRGGTFAGSMAQTNQDLLGGGLNLTTPVWGFGIGSVNRNRVTPLTPVTYPGATFVASTNTPVTIRWRNNLPLAYVLRRGNGVDPVVDTTLHWAFGKVPGTFTANGVPVVVHVHGGHSADAIDGLPEHWFTPDKPKRLRGDDYVTNNYEYLNDQEGATLWYHDHALGITRQNVYAGLAGFYFLRDGNENFLIANDMIPKDAYELEMVIQDRMFYPDGRLAYPDATWVAPATFDTFPAGAPSHQPEFFGQIILVNGKAWPTLNVEPRQYRFRLLNGSDSRFYNLWLAPSAADSGPMFLVIGNDGGFLNAPVPLTQLTVGPGERYDVVIDFSAFAGQTIVVRNNARSPFPRGATVDPQLDGRIMRFTVGTAVTGPGPVAPVTPATNLRPLSGPLPVPGTGRVRKLLLFEAMDRFGRLQPVLGTVDPAAPVDPATGQPRDGTFLWDDPTTEKPRHGSTEIWEIHNATVDAHPIHLHLVQFRILNRQRFTATVVPKANPNGHTGTTMGGALRNVQYTGAAQPPGAYEAGFKDTAIMLPGEVTRVVATFDKLGRWVWHCHILSHEDHEMMRRFEVIP